MKRLSFHPIARETSQDVKEFALVLVFWVDSVHPFMCSFWIFEALFGLRAFIMQDVDVNRHEAQVFFVEQPSMMTGVEIPWRGINAVALRFHECSHGTE